MNGKCFEQLATFHYGEYQHLSLLHIQPQILHGKSSGGLPHHEYDAHTNSVQIPRKKTCKKIQQMQRRSSLQKKVKHTKSLHQSTNKSDPYVCPTAIP